MEGKVLCEMHFIIVYNIQIIFNPPIRYSAVRRNLGYVLTK